jgi:hypothetical protein
MTYLSYTMAVGTALEGSHNEYAMDVLIVTLVVQVGTMVTDYFWYLFLVIPGYISYRFGATIWLYVFRPKYQVSYDI